MCQISCGKCWVTWLWGWFMNLILLLGDACWDNVLIHFSELLPTLIGRLNDLFTFTVMFVQLFLFLWQSLSLMDVDEDTSGYLEFIGEFRSLSNVIAISLFLVECGYWPRTSFFVLYLCSCVFFSVYMSHFIALLFYLNLFTTWNGILLYLLIVNYFTHYHGRTRLTLETLVKWESQHLRCRVYSCDTIHLSCLLDFSEWTLPENMHFRKHFV